MDNRNANSVKTDTITVRMGGGLGNQFFQYAFGRALGIKRNAILHLDKASGFASDAFCRLPILQRYQLGPSDSVMLVSPKLLPGQSDVRFLKLLSWIQPLFGVKLGPTVYHEKKLFAFDGAGLECRLPAYFVGYWQNLKYFEGEAALLRREFCLKDPLSAEAAGLVQEIESNNSVAIHVRRYDLSDMRQFGRLRSDQLTLGDSFYQEAVFRIERNERDITYYLFSDAPVAEPLWLRGKRYRRIDSSLIKDDAVEHTLMSRCKHHIVANSTYSWWAAWLNDNPAKKVVAPRQWFKSHMKVDGIFPTGWIILG